MAPRNPQDPGDRRNPWTRPGYITAATFLGALVILAIILVATSGSGTTHTTQTQASNPTPAPHHERPGDDDARSGNPDRLHPPRRQPERPVHIAATGNLVGAGRFDEHTSSAHDPGPAARQAACYGIRASLTALPARFSLRSTSGLKAPRRPQRQVFRHLAISGLPRTLGTNSAASTIQRPGAIRGYKYESYTPSKANLIVVIKGQSGRP